MIELPHPLPPGALLSDPRGALHDTLRPTGAIWWDATGLETDARTGALTAWTPRLGTAKAVPTDPNTGHGTVGEAGDLIGLQCRPGIHCGMVAPGIVADAATLTLALRYLPPFGADARTLATVNTGGAANKAEAENYLYVSEANGTLTIRDDKGLLDLSLPAPQTDAPRLVILSLSSQRLRAEIVSGARGETTARAPVLHGPASLFIGCRNQRPGLAKTLGGALITDLWLWPGRCLWDGSNPSDLIALRRFELWSEAA